MRTSPASSLLRTVLALLLASAAAFPLAAQETAYHFARIPWGSGSARVQEGMRQAGFTLIESDSTGDMLWEGRIAGERADVLVTMAPGGMAGVSAFVTPPAGGSLRTYGAVRDLLAAEHGAPSSTVESYSAPYTRGDGRAEEAIRARKARVGSLWGTSADNQVALLVSEDLAVVLRYYSPALAPEEARRRGAGGS